MSGDLRSLSTAELEAELRRRKDAENLLRHIDNALSALGQDDLVIRLESGRGTLQERLGYGATFYDMRALLAEGMRVALITRKAQLDVNP